MSAATAGGSGHVDGSGGFGEQPGGLAQRVLATIERVGNKRPEPGDPLPRADASR